MYNKVEWFDERDRRQKIIVLLSFSLESIVRQLDAASQSTAEYVSIVRDVSSSGKGIPRKKILRYDHFHFLSAQSVENKSGVSYVTKNIMVDVLFTDSIKGADGNTENSFKETIPTGLTLSVDYYRVIIVRPLRTTKQSTENSESWVSNCILTKYNHRIGNKQRIEKCFARAELIIA